MTSAAADAQEPGLARALVAEALGTALLVCGVVGSGIMAQRLTHDVALMLLCNAIATGAVLTVLILAFASLSGAHFNPAVTLSFAMQGRISRRAASLYVPAQIAGGILGTWAAHLMFGLPILAAGVTARTGVGQWFAEAVATFGLLTTILGCCKQGRTATAAAVGLYITAAYWFTASTSFANPAVTIARSLTPSFAGIRPADAPAFVAVQFAAAILGTALLAWLFRMRLARRSSAQFKPRCQRPTWHPPYNGSGSKAAKRQRRLKILACGGEPQAFRPEHLPHAKIALLKRGSNPYCSEH